MVGRAFAVEGRRMAPVSVRTSAMAVGASTRSDTHTRTLCCTKPSCSRSPYASVDSGQRYPAGPESGEGDGDVVRRPADARFRFTTTRGDSIDERLAQDTIMALPEHRHDGGGEGQQQRGLHAVVLQPGLGGWGRLNHGS